MNLGVVLKTYGLDAFSYLRYFPIILGLVFLLLNKFRFNGLSIKKNPLNAAFSLLIINGILHFPLIDNVGFFQLFFISAALLPFLVFKNFEVNLRVVSLIYIIGFLLTIGGNTVLIDFSLERFFTSDTSSLETNQHPFVFGILTLLFLYKKENKYFLLNLLFVILSFKRIVFLGVLASVPFVLIERNNRTILKNKRWLFLVLNILLISIIISFTSGLYDDFIREITGLSVGHFTMGRNSLYKPLIDVFNKMNLWQHLFGLGQSYSYNLTLDIIGNSPHNDLLVILIDHGIIVFSLFFLWIYKEKKLFPIIFTNVLFLTDNTLIYVFYLFIFMLIVDNLRENNENTYST